MPQRVDIYTPIRVTAFRNAWQYPTLARLKPGTTFAQVQAGLDALSVALRCDYPGVLRRPAAVHDRAWRFRT